jgi:hypothetical protein
LVSEDTTGRPLQLKGDIATVDDLAEWKGVILCAIELISGTEAVVHINSGTDTACDAWGWRVLTFEKVEGLCCCLCLRLTIDKLDGFGFDVTLLHRALSW